MAENESTKRENKPQIIGKDFVVELARYFMTFLETDFKKRRQPKRNLSSRINKGLSVGLYLNKYPTLHKEMYKNLISGFSKEKLTIKQGQFTTRIPISLMELVNHRIDKLSNKDIASLIKDIIKDIDKARLNNQDQYDIYLEEAIEQVKQSLTSKIIVPLISDINKPLQAAGLSTAVGLFQLEVDSTDKLFNILEGSIDGVLRRYYADNEKSKTLQSYFEDQFPKNTVINILKTFFHDFSTADAYSEIYQLHRNKEMLDKTELYIYFCEINVNTFSFPLFYSPVVTTQDGTEINLEMDSRIFVNTKAIEYVLQEYNTQTGNNEKIGNKIDRILYIVNKEELLSELQKVVNRLSSILDLDIDTLDLKDSISQSKANLVVKINNRLQLFLFDKSDEALINDYEEIINDDGGLAESFSELINGFMFVNPGNFIEEVNDEWREKDNSEKLVIPSPVPLNEEQKQVMLALQKDDCNLVILEGPPGTGKSHTITAIVCKAILDGQSVLVLSDKDEALDVVQDKITETLKTIRHDNNFQNPILRLGKSGGLAKVIDGQSLERVREHYHTYKSKEDDFEKQFIETQSDTKAEINRIGSITKEIKLNEIIILEESALKYEGCKWIEADRIDELKEPFQLLYKAVCHINKSKEGYLLDYSGKSGLENVEMYLENLKAYIDAKSSVKHGDPQFITEFKKLDDANQLSIKDKLVLISTNSLPVLEYSTESPFIFMKDIKESELLGKFTDRHKNFYILEDITRSSNSYLENVDPLTISILEQLARHNLSFDEVKTTFKTYVDTIVSLRSKLFGFVGKSNNIERVTREIKGELPYLNILKPEKHLKELQTVMDYLEFIEGKMKQLGISDDYWTDIINLLKLDNESVRTLKERLGTLSLSEDESILSGYCINDAKRLLNDIWLLDCTDKLLAVVHENNTINSIIGLRNIELVLSDFKVYENQLEKLSNDYGALKDLIESQKVIINFASNYPDVAKKLGINLLTPNVLLIDQVFKDMSIEELGEYILYLATVKKYQELFKELSIDNYVYLTKKLETLTAAKMAYSLDSSVIEYVNKNGSDIMTLKSFLKSKRQFPKASFNGLKQAFPCILAGIRDYATYIPLKKDLFDLVIIDEASQVSIAQSLPALIRGKKILVLGDDKQFSNVKAGNASKLTNDQLKNQVLSKLRHNISGLDNDSAQLYLSKAEKNFDIKNSVLEFSRFIANYKIMLKKHFRCYPEIIEYSNKNFYNYQLQCMKARALPISEVIKFDYVPQDGLEDQYYNTNSLELEFIIEQLSRLKERGYEGTIGVITPHREQASLIYTTLTTSNLSEWLKEHKIKVMTFDTCQGEERDYIFYSMVATKENDKHRYVFPKSLESESDNEESNVRRQRLNVGFSRAKETVHFVLSKPIDEYWGEARNALSFYERKLNEASNIVIGGTDPKSGMEAKIQHYFYETSFYKEYKDRVELIPQFPLGDYLRSLDRTYQHPSYKVDFLMVYDKHKIVIEYDGFKEHFIDDEGINEDNFMSYLKEDDVYRQKVLEGYGYKFIRLNKFNLKNDPINNMNDLLYESVKKKS